MSECALDAHLFTRFYGISVKALGHMPEQWNKCTRNSSVVFWGHGRSEYM